MDIPEKNKHYFAKNLLVLQQSQPDLSFRISKLKPSSCYQWLETKTGSYSVEISSGKTPLLLHSRHDPIKEAKREIRSLSVDTPSVFVFLGIGLGHSLDVLWEQHRGDITALLLVERNVEFFYFFLHASDWTHILSNPNTRILVSDKADDILTAAHSLLPQIMGSGIRFVDHRPSYQIHADFYAKCVENLRRFLQQAAAESELLVQHGSLIQRNAILNLPAMCSSHGLGPLRNYFKDQPAVLIAAGPSLNNTIKHLKKYRTDVLVFCVDTAYSLVLKEGIVPDFVSATDPTELNERHFDGIPPQNKVVLLFESDVYPTIPERWKGPLIFVNSEKSAINRWIEEIGGPFGSFDQGLSVSHTQYTAASWLGCSPIILIGHDFAYSPGGGFTHAKGTVLNRKIQPPKSEAKDVVIEKSTFIPTDTVEEIDWVLGVRGSLVPTSKTLKVLLAKFSDMIKISGSTVFDATEAGALIEGSIPTKFESILCSLERNTQVSPIVSFLEEHQTGWMPLRILSRLCDPVCLKRSRGCT